ncbi:FAD-dependent oxidoreductase [Haloparvum sedimenti]|uniref:FAD-dependent oxidoreductase n=1 Tax=Haloparvum sedimenti TaxID=1678448 RepID=UPI00071E79D1|nr:FAD-dependent oxidoreductase [Haloparvum sedimenti]
MGDAEAESDREGSGADRDVVVVGGGPAGSAAAVFTARYGLDTLVFDRGNAALPRCAYLENYPGFPGGIPVDAFRDLLDEHVREAGATIEAELVERVDRSEEGFVVETDEGTTVTAESVVAASWYDGSYLRPLDEGDMFTEQEHHGEVEERFDPTYPDADGRTDVTGLYVASPADDRSAQAVVAAGNGAHVARGLIADRRREEGFTGEVVDHYDWLRQDSEFSGEWAERDRWREWFDNETEGETDTPEHRERRERYIDRAFETRRTPEEVEDLAERGLRRFVETVGTDRVLDALDEEAIREHLAEAEETDD